MAEIRKGDYISIDGGPTRVIAAVRPVTVPHGVSITLEPLGFEPDVGGAPAPTESSQADRGGARDFDYERPLPPELPELPHIPPAAGVLEVTGSKVEEHLAGILGGVIVLVVLAFVHLAVQIF